MTDHILIVEDDADIAMLIEVRLRRQGYETRRACNGALGLASFLDEPPTIIVTDRAMPALDGVEMTRKIRASGGTQPRIIMVSASTTAADQQHARDAGVDDYVTKPIAFPRLLELVSEVYATLAA